VILTQLPTVCGSSPKTVISVQQAAAAERSGTTEFLS
jgi:hypothetical protein